MNKLIGGEVLCGCKLISRCGAGAYGEVWLAENPVGARVAIKIVARNGKTSDREIAGLRNYCDCNHPNLLKIRHVEFQPDRIIYSMDAADDLNEGTGDEYLPDTLANRLDRVGRMDGEDILRMLDGLLDGLEELHRLGLVHRDIKPDNILWVNKRPTFADAGLIAVSGQGTLVGTPGFLSKALLSGKQHATAEDDFYALGKVIYCALTGNPVQDYPSIPLDMTISSNADWGKVFRRACSISVGSAREFRKLLRESCGVFPGQTSNGISSRARKFIQGGIIGALALALVATGFWVAKRWKKPQVVNQPQVTETTQQETTQPTTTTPTPITATPPASDKPTINPEANSEEQMQRIWFESNSAVMDTLRELGYWKKDQMKKLLGLSDLGYDLEHYIDLRNFEYRQYGVKHPKPRPDFSEIDMKMRRIWMKIRLDSRTTYYAQRRWYKKATERPNEELKIQREMLAMDKTMQAHALWLAIGERTWRILQLNVLTTEDEEYLDNLIQLHNTLTQ